jgi:uncharacterized RDD family membrane protein YckC
MSDVTDFSKPGGQQPEPQPNWQAPSAPQGQPAAYPPPPPAGYPQGPPPGYPQAGGQSGYGYPAAPPPGAGYGYPGGGLNFPPGVELASHGRRIGAYFLAFPLVIVTLVIGYLIWGAVLWGKGTSPALKVLKMKVVDANTGQVVGWGKMFLRDFVGGIVQGILSIITYLISLILFLSGEKRQTIPDKVASTVVVYDPNGVLG